MRWDYNRGVVQYCPVSSMYSVCASVPLDAIPLLLAPIRLSQSHFATQRCENGRVQSLSLYLKNTFADTVALSQSHHIVAIDFDGNAFVVHNNVGVNMIAIRTFCTSCRR